VSELLSQASFKLAVALGNPMHTIEDENRLNKLLGDKSNSCESLANMMRAHYSTQPQNG